jgi:hypothetical protein
MNITSENVRRMHDLLDDLNAEHADADRLCLFCDARHYDAHVGIVHAPTCVIIRMRAAMPDRLDW